MIRFECDYGEGAHPKILEKLTESNFQQTPGYGLDEYCQRAEAHIKKLIGNDNCHVHFLTGGTQTNLVVISSILKSYEGVISAVTGHINTHETGAIEATGHKVIVLESKDGKISASQVKETYLAHLEDEAKEHCVAPGMVYISHPTENGTIYTKKELEELSEVCRKYNLPLFMDGARLGYGLAAMGNDLELSHIAQYCDVFYIGGTKVGALFGEAVVITNDRLKQNFRYAMKQRGALLAKGRLLGIQFECLFEDGLYTEISKHAVDMAMIIKDACIKKGYEFLYDSPTNQQFPIMPIEKIEKLFEKYSFHLWKKMDENYSAVRLCTSWATEIENVQEFVRDLEGL